MKKINVCPFCGGENLVLDGDHYVCQNKDCERFIYEDTPQLEDLRHKISAKISAVYGTEETPLVCKTPITIGEEEAQGLSSLELPQVVSLFHDYEAIVWFNIDGGETIEFDALTLEEAQAIWNEIKYY